MQGEKFTARTSRAITQLDTSDLSWILDPSGRFWILDFGLQWPPDHNTGILRSLLIARSAWVLQSPLLTSTDGMQVHGFRRCHSGGSTFSSVILSVGLVQSLNSRPPARQSDALQHELIRRRLCGIFGMLKVFCFACAYKSSATLPSAIVIIQPLLLFNAMKIMLLFY